MTNNDLHEKIAACGCVTCRALTSIRTDAGARINISTKKNGRMCELAVVAAAGPGGLTGGEVVARRAAYARHLGIELTKGMLGNLTPYVIRWAIRNSNHTDPETTNEPVNLGNARATVDAYGRYFLTWDVAVKPGRLNVPFAASATAPAMRRDDVTHGIEIAWPAGIERIALDLGKLGVHTRVIDTVQHIDDPGPRGLAKYEYRTTSELIELLDGAFRLMITYAHEDNQHICQDDSWWGTTTLEMRPGDLAGTVQWSDTNDPASDGQYTFHIAAWDDEDEESRLRADEAEIRRRTDLTPTEKLQQIRARRGQGEFRARVLRNEPRCRVTGIDDPAHLRASHIKPWAEADDGERLDGDNGLMLSPHIDHLFDKAYISFNDEGRLLVLDHPAVHALLAAWKIDPITSLLPARPFNARQRIFLAEHRLRLARRQAG